MFVVFTVLIALHIALNLLNVNLLAKLNTFSAWWHMIGVAIIVVICLVVPSQLQSPSYVFGEIVNNSGFAGDSWVGPASGSCSGWDCSWPSTRSPATTPRRT